MPTRTAYAQWKRDLHQGKGTMRLESGAFEGPYSFSSRFEEGPGSNPEELIAAAHAGCFSMALSGELGNAGFVPESVETTAKVTVEQKEQGFTITKSELITVAEVPGIDENQFAKIADQAKAGCPVSRALAGVEITLEARLV